MLAAVLAVVLVGCAGAPPAESADPPAAAGTATASAAPGPQASAPRSAGWLAGNHITVDAASYDSETGEVRLETHVENTANTESVGADLYEYLLLDTGEGAPAPVSSVSSVAVPSSTTAIELTFLLAPQTPLALDDASLVLGGPGFATWRIPLADASQPDGTEPADHAFSGVADAGGLSFTATQVQVLPWACDDVDDYGPAETGRITYAPGGEGEAAFIVWGDIHEAQSIVGGDTPLAASLALPDGTVAAQIGTVYTVFDVNEGIDDYPLCFTVPAPASGTYTLTWNSYRGASAALTIELGD